MLKRWVCFWFHRKHYELFPGGGFDCGFEYGCHKCGRIWHEE